MLAVPLQPANAAFLNGMKSFLNQAPVDEDFDDSETDNFGYDIPTLPPRSIDDDLGRIAGFSFGMLMY